jgi:hypothetical protein
MHLDTGKRAQRGGDVRGRLRFLVGELGMLVQVSPPGDHLRFDGVAQLVELRGRLRRAHDRPNAGHNHENDDLTQHLSSPPVEPRA